MPREQLRKFPLFTLPRVPLFQDARLRDWAQKLTRALEIARDPYTVGARVTRVTNQTITQNTTTAVQWTATDYDNGGLFTSTLNTRLTAPISGIYGVTATSKWDVSATGARQLRLLLNGATTFAHVREAGDTEPAHCIATFMNLASGDYVETVVRHNAGADLALTPTSALPMYFAMHWLSPLQE
jgi:hypothetical protein